MLKCPGLRLVMLEAHVPPVSVGGVLVSLDRPNLADTRGSPRSAHRRRARWSGTAPS